MHGTEVYHGCGTQTYVHYICAGIRNASDKAVADLFRRYPAVPSHKYFVSGKEVYQEVSYLVCDLRVEISSEDSSDIVGVECSHLI